MKYTLLTAAALATVAIAAPAPEKAVSLGNLALGDGSDNKVTIEGNFLVVTLSLEHLTDVLGLHKKTIEVPTQRKAKAKRGHHQGGAQLLNILNVLSGDVLGNTDAIGNILVRIGTGDITRVDGTRQCLDLLRVITGLLNGAVRSLTSGSGIGGGGYEEQEVIGILDPLVSGVSRTVNNVVRTLGVGRGRVGSDALTPVTSSLSSLLRCLLDIDSSLGPSLKGILESVLGGVGTGTDTGTGTGLLGGLLSGLLGEVLDPVKGVLHDLNLGVKLKIGGKKGEESTGGDGSSGSGSGSSGSGNESPVYNVPT
ncbi:hypothetical protein CDV31_005826 [Fusarium ambrosium]|uniref:Uncharacterized protein n=1 Tax=Fusarium ambrosium TaxID=131363 RepID=A0A428UGV5_9HYPO|nr:hypothetical protein CDV31_005826 [Fusarium ambrosium]